MNVCQQMKTRRRNIRCIIRPPLPHHHLSCDETHASTADLLTVLSPKKPFLIKIQYFQQNKSSFSLSPSNYFFSLFFFSQSTEILKILVFNQSECNMQVPEVVPGQLFEWICRESSFQAEDFTVWHMISAYKTNDRRNTTISFLFHLHIANIGCFQLR